MIKFPNKFLNNNENHGVLYTTEFDIDEPGIYCLVGGNGTGKSTLINNLIKIQKPYPETFYGKKSYIFNLDKLLGECAQLMLDKPGASSEEIFTEFLGKLGASQVSEGERLFANLQNYINTMNNVDPGIFCFDEIDTGLSDDRCKIVAELINNLYKVNKESIIIIASNHYSLYNNINNPIFISMKSGQRIQINNYEDWIKVITEISNDKNLNEIADRALGYKF